MRRAAVIEVSVDEPLRELEVADRYDRVLLVPTFRGEVLGEALVPAARALTVEAQRSAFCGKVAERLLRRRLTLAFQAAAGVQRRDGGADARSPTVSVVVCARAGSEANLAATLESLRGLRRAPDEIIVAGPVSIGPDTPHVIERSGNLARAANRGIAAARGEVIAMTRDGCAVNPRWLDSVDASLSDPLVMAAVGYAGPEAIETRADWAAHRQAARGRRRGRIDTRNALFRS